jgi:hypothetical protein
MPQPVARVGYDGRMLLLHRADFEPFSFSVFKPQRARLADRRGGRLGSVGANLHLPARGDQIGICILFPPELFMTALAGLVDETDLPALARRAASKSLIVLGRACS